jgi:hypothetical protein
VAPLDSLLRHATGLSGDLLPDSIFTIKKGKQLLLESVQGQSASFEAGRLSTPDVQAADLPGVSIPDMKRLTNRIDSLGGALDPKRIFSDRLLRQWADSLGISRMDTLLALMNLRQDVSQDELLESLYHSFPALGGEGDSPVPMALGDLAGTDISKLNLPESMTSQLPPLAGYRLPSHTDQLIDSVRRSVRDALTRERLRETYHKVLDSLQFADSLRWVEQLVADGHNMDSLAIIEKTLSSMDLPEEYTSMLDSLQPGDPLTLNALNSLAGTSLPREHMDRAAQLYRSRGRYINLLDSMRSTSVSDASALLKSRYRQQLDSLDKIDYESLFRQSVPKRYTSAVDSMARTADRFGRFNVKESQWGEDARQLVLQEKPTFLQHFNFEGVLGFLQSQDSSTLVQFSPALEFSVGRNLSVGAGPNLILSKSNDGVSVAGGYRVMSKYYVFHQRAYIHAEDAVDPKNLNKEYFEKARHSALLGAGYLLKISPSLALNALLLYRLNNQSYSQGVVSPFVFRIGLSSIKSLKDE